MALQALPQAIQYDNTPNQMLARLADDLRQQRVYEQRLRDEDNARKFQLLQSISPEVLNEKFDKEVVNASIVGLRDNVSQFLAKNPNASSTALQEMIQKQLGSVAQWSNKAKMIRENIANTAKELKSTKGIDVAGLQAAAITRAFKNPDGSLKTPDQLNADIDWASDTYAQAPDKFIDIAEVGKGFEDRLNKAQKIDRNKSVSVVRGGKDVTETVKYTIYPWQDIDAKGNVVTKKDKGFLIEDQYQALVPSGSVDDVYWTRLAKNQIQAHNRDVAAGKKDALKIGQVSIADPGNIELVKRALVTNFLDQKSGSSFSNLKDENQIKVNVNVGDKNKSPEFIDGFKKVEDLVKAGGYRIKRVGGKEAGLLLNQFDADVVATFVDIANSTSVSKKDTEGNPIRYTQDDLLLRVNKDGTLRLIDDATGKELPIIRRSSFNRSYNASLGNKAEMAGATDQENNKPTQPVKPVASGIKWK